MVRKSGFDSDWFGSEEILLDRQKKQKKGYKFLPLQATWTTFL